MTTHESTLDPVEVKRLRATFSLIVAHSKRPNNSRSSLELMDESGETMDTTDKRTGEEQEERNILPQQRAVSASRQEGTENTQDAEPDGVDVAIDTRRAGDNAQRSGGQNTELDTGNWPPTAEEERDEDWACPGNNTDPTDTVYEAPVIATINKPVATRMGPPARTKQTRKVPAAPGENKGKQIRFAWEEGLDIIRMYVIIQIGKAESQPPKISTRRTRTSIQRDDATGM